MTGATLLLPKPLLALLTVGHIGTQRRVDAGLHATRAAAFALEPIDQIGIQPQTHILTFRTPCRAIAWP